MITSASLFTPAVIVSNTTAAGSAPSLCLTMSTSARSAQISSWSIAAARNVSAAPRITFLPSDLKYAAILPIVVVLPTPFTPITRITAGVVTKSIVSSSPSMSATTSLMTVRTSEGSLIPLADTLSFNSSIILSAVNTPTSPITRTSVSSS